MSKISIILVILLMPCLVSASPLTTYAVNAIATAPAGNEIDGALVGAFVPIGLKTTGVIGNIVLTIDNEFILGGVVTQPTVGNISTRIITYAINGINDPIPAGDEIDGSFNEGFISQGMVIQPTVGNLSFIALNEFLPQPVVLQATVSNYGTLNWETGVEWADGLYWENDEIVMIVPDGGSIDVIVWDGF